MGFSSNGTTLAAVEASGLSGGAGVGSYPAFNAGANASTTGNSQITLNSYTQGVSASAFTGIAFRHQYVTGTSDRSVAALGFRRANATSGSQLTNFVLSQRVTEGAALASVIETNSSGDLLIGGTLPGAPKFSVTGSNGDVLARGNVETSEYFTAAALGTIYQAQAQVDAPRPSAFSVTLSNLVNSMGCGTIYFWAYNTSNILNACATGAYHFAQNPLGGGSYTQTVAQAITNVGAASITGVTVAKSGTWDITISGSYTGNVPIRVGACAVGVTVGFGLP